MRKNFLCMCVGIGASLIGIQSNYYDKLAIFYSSHRYQELRNMIIADWNEKKMLTNTQKPFDQVRQIGSYYKNILFWRELQRPFLGTSIINPSLKRFFFFKSTRFPQISVFIKFKNFLRICRVHINNLPISFPAQPFEFGRYGAASF